MRSHLSGVDRTPDLFGEAPPEGASEAAIRDCWGTPDALYRWIIAGCGGRFAACEVNKFGPCPEHVIDLFADDTNHKAPVYLTVEADAFSRDWLTLMPDGTEPVVDLPDAASWLRFGNPPFSRVIDACTKARAESDKHPKLDIVLIIPGPMGTENDRAGNSYANTHRLADAVLFLTPRVNFIPPPGIKDSSASGATTVLAWGPAARRFVERRNGANVEFHVEWK